MMQSRNAMFETVAPGAIAVSQRRLQFGTLPLSLGLHATVITLFLLSTHISFPDHPPKFAMSYLLIGDSGALPPLPKGVDKPMTPPKKAEAPPEVPKTVPDVTPAPPIETNEFGAQREAAGKADGEAGGIATGVAGGILEGDGRIHFGIGGVLPMTVLAMDYPAYPEAARKARAEGDSVIRYIVGKEGVVTDVTVVEPASWLMFDEAAVAAIRKWRFEPLIYGGMIREVVHEVRIQFRLQKEVQKTSG
jgi:protein TonB